MPDKHKIVMKNKAMQLKKPCAFIDRDGVLNEWLRGEDVTRVSELIVKPNLGKPLSKIKQAGWWIVVVTNQSAIAKGQLSYTELEKIHHALLAAISHQGGSVDLILFSPDAEPSPTRKPNIGMISEAASKLPIDLKSSVMIGDSWRDMELAKNAGLRFLGIDGGAGFKKTPESLYSDLNSVVEESKIWT